MDFGTQSVIARGLDIGSGTNPNTSMVEAGAVNTNPLRYGSNAVLNILSWTGTYGMGLEWSAGSALGTPGVPNHVLTLGDVDMSAGDRTAVGEVVVRNGTLTSTSGTLSIGEGLTVSDDFLDPNDYPSFSVFDPNGGTLEFNGGGPAIIDLFDAGNTGVTASFNNIDVTAGTEVTITKNVSTSLSGSLTGAGRFSETLAITGVASHFFLCGVNVAPTNVGDFTSVQVDRIGTDPPGVTAPEFTQGEHFEITTNGTSFDGFLILPHSIVPDSNAYVTRVDAVNSFQPVRDGSTATTVIRDEFTTYAARVGVSPFSTWAATDGAPTTAATVIPIDPSPNRLIAQRYRIEFGENTAAGSFTASDLNLTGTLAGSAVATLNQLEHYAFDVTLDVGILPPGASGTLGFTVSTSDVSYETATTFTGATGPEYSVISPTDYVWGGIDDTVFRLDLDSGDRAEISGPTRGSGSPMIELLELVQESANNLLVLSSEQIFRVDIPTGDRTVLSASMDGKGQDWINDTIGSGSFFQYRGSIELDASGDILLLSPVLVAAGPTYEDMIIRVDPTTGDRTVLSGGGTGAGIDLADAIDLTVEPGGDILVSVNPVLDRRPAPSSCAWTPRAATARSGPHPPCSASRPMWPSPASPPTMS